MWQSRKTPESRANWSGVEGGGSSWQGGVICQRSNSRMGEITKSQDQVIQSSFWVGKSDLSGSFFRLLIRAFTGGATYMTTASAILEVATRGARQCWDSVKQSLFDCLKSCLLVCACYPLLPYELHLSGSKSNYQTFVWLLCTRNEIYQQQQQ